MQKDLLQSASVEKILKSSWSGHADSWKFLAIIEVSDL